MSHFGMVGVSGKPSFIRRNGVPSSCFSAAMKYRLSVQSAASEMVTTAVPALPSKPLIHCRVCQCAGTYSPWCGSVLGKMKASRPLPRR